MTVTRKNSLIAFKTQFREKSKSGCGLILLKSRILDADNYDLHFFLSQVLCLNHNHIESIIPRKTGTNSPQVTTTNKNLSDDSSVNRTPVLENLEVLHLG